LPPSPVPEFLCSFAASSLRVSRRVVALVCLALFAAAAALAQRDLPHDGKYVAKAQFNYPFVKLGKAVVRLSVGSRIYNEQNMIIMPVSAPASADVLYRLDMNGEISQIWILTPEESKATAAALKK
jgi:hypothetical protein